MLLIEQRIQELSAKLPLWKFARYSNKPGVQIIACYPPSGPSLDAWLELEKIGERITAVCGPLYTVNV